MEDQNRKWLWLVDQPSDEPQNEFRVENARLINLDAVRLVDQVTPTHVRLVFSEEHTLEIHGSGAGELVMTLMARGMTVFGAPFKDPRTMAPTEDPNPKRVE